MSEDLQKRVWKLESEVQYWQDTARRARGLTRCYMRIGEVLIEERAGLEAKIDKLEELVSELGSEYCVSISEDLKGERE